ncbi:hypothetical protein ASE01_16880 [Nocardioides sp. Root190]|nr:hypothetical protein ASE01_16880 [Nocardioides sp. Root190]
MAGTGQEALGKCCSRCDFVAAVWGSPHRQGKQDLVCGCSLDSGQPRTKIIELLHDIEARI